MDLHHQMKHTGKTKDKLKRTAAPGNGEHEEEQPVLSSAEIHGCWSRPTFTSKFVTGIQASWEPCRWEPCQAADELSSSGPFHGNSNTSFFLNLTYKSIIVFFFFNNVAVFERDVKSIHRFNSRMTLACQNLCVAVSPSTKADSGLAAAWECSRAQKWQWGSATSTRSSGLSHWDTHLSPQWQTMGAFLLRPGSRRPHMPLHCCSKGTSMASTCPTALLFLLYYLRLFLFC